MRSKYIRFTLAHPFHAPTRLWKQAESEAERIKVVYAQGNRVTKCLVQV